MTYSMVGYSIGLYHCDAFPIESPWFSMAGMWNAPLDGGPITATISFIEHYGRVRGAAFPSAHVAGSICGALGSVEVPAMVVLGDGAAGVSDVRFHDLGKVSLHRGYFGDCNGDAGVCGWELGDGTEECRDDG